MTKQEKQEILGSGAGLGAAIAIESGSELGESQQTVRARGYWENVWRRLRRDKVAIGSAIYIVFLLLVAGFGAPIAAHLLGHGPNKIFLPGGVDKNLLPVDPWTHVVDPDTGKKTLFIFGGSDTLGRDEFLRLLYGARASLEVALISTIDVMIIGVILGSIAGYFGGWIDTVVSRITEVTMAFPALLFIIALAATVGPSIDDITFGVFGKGVITLVLVFSVFGWFYPARIMRAQTLSLREKEYVEAARMVGASDWRIIRSHVLPHLVAPIIVYATLAVAGFILAEAGLSFLGVGIKTPTASWGSLLSDAATYYTTQPWLMVWPGIAMLLTTLAFNLLGDGLRDAIDPRATQ